MKTANKSILTNVSLLLAFFMVFGVTTGCSSSNDPEPKPDPEEVVEPETPEHTFNTLLTIKNLHTPYEGTQKFTLFSLEQGTTIDEKYAKTRLWDISFDNLFSSFINANNKKEGYGKDGLGDGGIILLNQKFEDVVNIPEDAEFKTGDTPYGNDKSGDWSDTDGWFLYDMLGTIRGEGAEGKEHVCYPLEDRTLVIRTARGNYAKLKIKSVYKDELDPANWSVKSAKTYYTIDYVLAKKGSKTFEIKQNEK